MYIYLFIVISQGVWLIGVKNSAWSIETNLHITDFNPLFVNTSSFIDELQSNDKLTFN